MWPAREKARGEELGRRPAWRRHVRAARTGGGTGRAAVAVSGGGLRRQRGGSVGRRGALGEGQQRGAKAVGEFGGDAWSGAGAGGSLAQHGTAACGGAAARQRGSRGRRRGRGCQGLRCKLQKL
jgi:hypothetical protein